VIVQVVAEGEDDIAGGLTLGGGIVTSLKKERCIAVSASADARKLGWGILQVGVAGGCTRHVLAELVEEHVAKDDIILIVKVDREDHDDTITVLLEPDGLVGAVVDLNDLAAAGALGGLVHHLVKDGGKQVARHAGSKTRDLGRISLRVDLADGDADGDIILGLRTREEAAVDLLEVLLAAVSLDLIPALAGDRDVQLALCGPKMPEDLVEVSDCDINLLSLLSDKLSVDDIVDNAVIRFESQRGCHFLCAVVRDKLWSKQTKKQQKNRLQD